MHISLQLKQRNYNLALEVASKMGNLAAVKEALAQGAEINKLNRSGRTPLHQATYHSRMEVVRELLSQGADPNALTGTLCLTALHQGMLYADKPFG